MIDTIIDYHNNENVDIQKAANEGIIAVVHKATEGATFQDGEYAKQRARAGQLGLLFGAYHFGTAAPVDQQLQNFINTATLGTGTFGAKDLVALDFEHNELHPDNTMSLAQAEELVTKFRQKFGFSPLIYGGPFLFDAANEHPASPLKNCPLWIANYNDVERPEIPSLFSKFLFWQFTDGKAPKPTLTAGVPCDRNRFDGTEADLRKGWPFRA